MEARKTASMTADPALGGEAPTYSVNVQGADAPEAFSAFLKKREPAFTGAPFRQA